MTNEQVGNFVTLHEKDLKKKHYVRTTVSNIGFNHNEIQRYINSSGDNFCLIVVRDRSIEGDFYAIPFSLFKQDVIDNMKLYNGVERSFVTITKRHELKIGGKLIGDISEYYGNTAILGYPSYGDVKIRSEIDEKESSPVFTEGAIKYEEHCFRERNCSLVRQKKAQALKEGLECEVCGMTFSGVYGDELGGGFIECHHIVPLSEWDEEKEITLNDLALVCSNCHSMLHRANCSLSIEELARIVRERK